MLWLISADPIIVEVAPNEENVQLPTETTEEWEAAPGGVFAPVRPHEYRGQGTGQGTEGGTPTGASLSTATAQNADFLPEG